LAQGHPHARALSDANEAGIADFIRVNHIRSGKGATGGLLQSLCLDSYLLQKEDERHRERSVASSTFRRGFEHRQGLALRTPHHERRLALDESYVKYFLGKLNFLSNDDPPELIFNMDETCWRLFEAPRKVLAEKRSDAVRFESTTGENTLSTALNAIPCASENLSLWVLAKKRIVQCEPKFGHHPTVSFRHYESG
jgi:hypothetical protein